MANELDGSEAHRQVATQIDALLSKQRQRSVRHDFGSNKRGSHIAPLLLASCRSVPQRGSGAVGPSDEDAPRRTTLVRPFTRARSCRSRRGISGHDRPPWTAPNGCAEVPLSVPDRDPEIPTPLRIGGQSVIYQIHCETCQLYGDREGAAAAGDFGDGVFD
jgi:hypothetical protein